MLGGASECLSAGRRIGDEGQNGAPKAVCIRIPSLPENDFVGCCGSEAPLDLAEVGCDEVGRGKGAPVIGKVVHDQELQQWVLPLIGAKGRTWVSEEGEQKLMKAGRYKTVRCVGRKQVHQNLQLGLWILVDVYREAWGWVLSVANQEDGEECRNVGVLENGIALLWPAERVILQVFAKGADGVSEHLGVRGSVGCLLWISRANVTEG